MYSKFKKKIYTYTSKCECARKLNQRANDKKEIFGPMPVIMRKQKIAD